MQRLTVHITKAKKQRVPTGKRIKSANGKYIDEMKEKLYNTISVKGLRNQEEIDSEISRIRAKHVIAINSKTGKEMIQLSWH